MMSSGRRTRKSFLLGLIVLVVGVVLLLGQLNIINPDQVFRFWPLLLVVFGIHNLVAGCGGGRRFWGVFLILAGVILQLENLGYDHIRFEIVWPVFIIAAGIMLILQAFGRSGGGGGMGGRGWWRGPSGSSGSSGSSGPPGTSGFAGPSGSSESQLNYTAIFGGGEHRISAKNFTGGEIVAIFGGFEIDLSQAEMEGDRAEIEITSLFGGGELRVPEHWTVQIEGAGIFGGYGDKTVHPQINSASPRKFLIIRGVSIFGGVSIKN